MLTPFRKRDSGKILDEVFPGQKQNLNLMLAYGSSVAHHVTVKKRSVETGGKCKHDLCAMLCSLSVSGEYLCHKD